jgi:hypothetical protein
LYAGTLEITTRPTDPPTDIRLHQTARGAIITSTIKTDMDFGSVKVGTPSSLPYNLTNSGNVDVTATLTLGTTVFQVDGAGSTTLPLAAGATGSKNITLTPAAATGYNDTLAISYGTAVHCQPPPKTQNLKGVGTTSVGVTPGSLNFGLVNCGTAGQFQTVTVTSTTAMNFTPSLGKSVTSPFSLADSNGSPLVQGSPIALAAASSYTMRIVPLTINRPAVTTANAMGDVLTVTTDVPNDTAHTVNLIQTAQGAIFAFNPGAGVSHTSPNLNAAIVPADTIGLVNTGNAAAPYSLTVTNRAGSPPPPANAFVLSAPTSGSAAVGTTNTTLTMTSPNTYNTTTLGALHVDSAGGILCADLPVDLPLTVQTGAGSSVSVTQGGLPVSTVAFGDVACGATATFQAVTISSIVTTTFTPNLVLGPSSPYTLADGGGTALALGSSIPLTAGTPYTLRIVPKTIPSRPPNGVATSFGDTLTISTPVDPTKNIQLTETAQGVIFSIVPTPIPPSSGPYPAPISFTLKNSGNVSGNYTITVTGGYASSNLTTGTAPVTPDTQGVLTFTAKGSGGSLSVASTSVLCADLPPPIPLTGN